MVRADGRSFVGPDNGLLSVVWTRARRRKCFRIAWRPARLSASFHGRDLFAPVAAALATRVPHGWLEPKPRPDMLLDARDLARVIYVDQYGNAITGMRALGISKTSKFLGLSHARTFENASKPFWYENSLGLVEIASPQGSAARRLGLRIGSPTRSRSRGNR